MIPSTACSPLAAELMKELQGTDSKQASEYRLRQMDAMPDQPGDDHQSPVPPEEIIMGGKYKNMMSMEEMYTQDKEYVKWVRARIKAQGSTVEMMRVRLYIEFRDNGKSNRLRHMDAQMTQGPIAPSRGRSSKDQPPKTAALASSKPKPRAFKTKTKRALGPEESEMDIEEWDTSAVEALNANHHWEALTMAALENDKEHRFRMRQLAGYVEKTDRMKLFQK